MSLNFLQKKYLLKYSDYLSRYSHSTKQETTFMSYYNSTANLLESNNQVTDSTEVFGINNLPQNTSIQYLSSTDEESLKLYRGAGVNINGDSCVDELECGW